MNEVILIRQYVNPGEDFESRHQAASEIFNTERTPQVGDWGICLCGDAPAGIGGQILVFNWFESQTELLAAISEHLVFTYLPPEHYDLVSAQAKIGDAISAYSAHDDALQLGRDLTNLLRTHIRVEWIGNFDQLMTSNDDFARGIRAQFFEEDDFDAVASVGSESAIQFREFISSWIG